MNKKNLPIKIFEKRIKTDERETEGAGSNELPKWAVLSAQELNKRVTDFKSVLEDVSDKLKSRKDENDFIPVVIKLEVNELAIAKSHRSDIIGLYDSKSGDNFIGLADERTILVKVNNELEVQKINKKLSKPESFLKAIASVTEISQFQPNISVDRPRKKSPLRVTLINYNNYQLNQSVEKSFEKLCRRNQITYKKASYTPELIIYRLSNVTSDAFDEIKEFEAMESISFMPKYSVGLDDLESASTKVDIKEPIEGRAYPIVGILDSGIKDVPHLKPWLLDDKFSKIPDSLIDPTHGTFVAGIVAYGDELEGSEYVGHEGCYLFDATVYPKGSESIEEFELVEHIKEAIEKKHKEIKIWNLSLGSRAESDLHEFSYFGKALDFIQERYGVVICKSAGNCKNFMIDKPISRVAKAADSIRSLVIGSVAHKKARYDISEINNPSPFSRIGKAPSYINKPELTHYGGNAGKKPSGTLVTSGVNSFALDGTVASNVGTSFSTPRVTSLLAELENKLGEDEMNPLLLKALAIHSAKYPANLSIPSSEKLKSMGYGIPSKAEDILYNDPYEITLILQDTLIKGDWIEIADFPFPKTLLEDGFYYGEIIVTLVGSPVLIESQGSEYCQSNIEVLLGTHDNLKKRVGPTIKNSIGLDGPQNLLSDGLYGARFRKNHIEEFARERTLIKYGDKYQPVKKYAVNLEEMTDANRTKHLSVPKKWHLQIKGLYRDFAVRQAERDATVLSQDFCVIITIRDSKRKHRVYDLTTKLLNDNGFIHNNIKIRSSISVPIR